MSKKLSNHYTVSILRPTTHIIEVSLHIPAPDPLGQVLIMPSWIPGSYMIREFAKNVTAFSATDDKGNDIEYTMLDKQTWKLSPSDCGITVRYSVYAFDLSIRSAFIGDEYAFFNGTSVFMKVKGQQSHSSNVTLKELTGQQYQDWTVSTTLPRAKGTGLHEFGDYQANTYQELIDHPVLYGKFKPHTFSVGSVSFELVLAGRHQADTQRIVRDLEKICKHHLAFFGNEPPVDRYVFMTLLCGEGFGGLEHMNSTALLFSRDDLPSPAIPEMTEGYRTFLSLCSHELFHTWHVKRIKPRELLDHDLQSEAYTDQLWIYEGFTSYYDDLALLRAGIIDRQAYLEVVGQNLTRLIRNQGRLKQTITNSSFLAWTRFYKQDASAINNIVSYYNKGAVIAMCLDLFIRQQSHHKHSLDDVMMFLWKHYGQSGTGTPPDVIHQCTKDLLGLDLDDFLHTALFTTDELPVRELLEFGGVNYHTRLRESIKDKGGKKAEITQQNWLGFAGNDSGDGIIVSQVAEGSPAQQAGLQLNDKVIAFDNWQVTSESLQKRLINYAAGQQVPLHVLRDKQLKQLDFTVKTAPQDTVYLTVNDETKLERWLFVDE